MDYSGKIITKNAVEPSQTSAPGVWTLDQAAQAVESNTWPIANVPNPISRSLRFNSADPTYLSRTFSSGDQQKWTFSVWLKKTTGRQTVFGRGSSQFGSMQFESSDSLSLNFAVGGTTYYATTTQVFRDPSAWYHLVWSIDTTQATASNRQKLYVNGSQVTAWSAYVDIPQNSNGNLNTANSHWIGRFWEPGFEFPFNGYMTQIQFIDGQQLAASSFGMTDPRTGAWISKPYTGTYGTNGFYLNFSDASSTAALGTDYSGNSNTWTTNNFSVTAGSGNDSMVDVPTNWVAYNTGDVGGVIRGNYATLNPLIVNRIATLTFSNGNLDASASTEWASSVSTLGMPLNGTDKWYAELTVNSGSQSNGINVGITSQTNNALGGNTAHSTSVSGVWYGSNAEKWVDGTSSSYGATFTNGDVIGIAVDSSANTITFYKNNTSQGAISLTSNVTSGAMIGIDLYNRSVSMNFGQRPFAYTPPAGFKSLCTTNLPEPTILDGGDYFNALIYTGDGTSNRSLTGLNFQPDFVWNKARSNAYGHKLYDAVRGVTKQLNSNTTNAEATTGTDLLVSFDSNGITIGSDTGFNGSGVTFVDWFWKESATSGFDIVTYTGTGSAQNIAHNLGVAPSMMIIKNRTSSANWAVWHTSYGGSTNTDYQYLNDTMAKGGGGAANNWGGTAPTSSVFTVGDTAAVNTSSAAYVAYLFAAVPGFSAFGSYTGNGSTDGPFVYCGFRPRYVLWKRTNTTGDWSILDTARDTYNYADKELFPNLSDAETVIGGGLSRLDILSNGFKVRGADSYQNASGSTYIYAAFAENPFKYSNAR